MALGLWLEVLPYQQYGYGHSGSLSQYDSCSVSHRLKNKET